MNIVDQLSRTKTKTKPAEDSASSEPPAGIKGPGTVDEPYDQGNKPEQAAGPGIEPPSGRQGAGTLDKPYDQGNQPENTSTTPSQSTSSYALQNSSGVPTPKSTPAQENDPQESRGRQEKAYLNTPRSHQFERSVSPGQLADGTHVKCSGDRGENYEPNTMTKLKGKLHFGKH